jgi:hypothetical protein
LLEEPFRMIGRVRPSVDLAHPQTSIAPEEAAADKQVYGFVAAAVAGESGAVL